MKLIPRRLLGVLLSTCAVAMLSGASAAQADNLSVLDGQATSSGHIIEDSGGNAYVTWTRKSASSLPDPVLFCKIPAGGECSAPITLPIPSAASAVDEVAGAFPVFGPGSVVYVVAPRYVHNDVVIWTSIDGGQTFNGGTINPGGYSNKSN